MSCFGCWPTCSFSRLPMRSATARAQKEKVLVLFGDSNFHYRPMQTVLAKLFGWQPESMGDMVRKQLSGRVILASSSLLAYRESTMKLVQTSMETIKSLSPDADFHVLVLCGQNDAVNLSRTEAVKPIGWFDDSRRQFQKLVEERTQCLEEEIPHATVYWVQPFDDPKGNFSAEYVTLVEDLRNGFGVRPRVVGFGPFTSFEADQVHLVTEERAKFANQVLEWFAAL